MKTMKGILLICILLMSGSLLQVNAQESMNRVIAKAEQLDYVKLDLIEQRNPETKQLSQRILTITWKSEDSMELMDEFRAAFER